MNPTVDELNEAQAEWMNLDAHAPEKEKRRVFALMERCPKCYVSGHDGIGVMILDGQPTSMTIKFELAMDRCKAFGGRTDVAWNGTTGKWYEVKPCFVNGCWFTARHHCRRIDGVWRVFHTKTGDEGGSHTTVTQAHKRMAELERIADAKEAR